MSQIPITTQLE